MGNNTYQEGMANKSLHASAGLIVHISGSSRWDSGFSFLPSLGVPLSPDFPASLVLLAFCGQVLYLSLSLVFWGLVLMEARKLSCAY